MTGLVVHHSQQPLNFPQRVVMGDPYPYHAAARFHPQPPGDGQRVVVTVSHKDALLPQPLGDLARIPPR
jgi:hypothetical protein